jgi:carboxypeptidase family protein
VVVANGGGTVAAAYTDEKGHFRIALTPGVYTVKATALPAEVTRPATTTVVVGGFASLTLELDSGIR